MKKILCFALCAASFPALAKEVTGGVYVATNNIENSIVGYKQYSDGTLSKVGEFKTGGKGTGFVELFGLPYNPKSGHTFTDGIDPLASAYGLWRSADNQNVLIANAGNGTVSSFHVQKDLSLKLVNVVPAGDVKPNGIASFKNLVYVVSMGKKIEDPSEGNVKGYTIDENGKLSEMPGSVRKLTGRPASVEFTSDGKFLLITEITTGVIHSYAVEDNGQLSKEPVSSIDSPQASDERFFALPIGTKMLKREDGEHTLLVTETRFITHDHKFHNTSAQSKKKYPFMQLFEGQTGSVTSYNIDKNGKLSVISPDVLAGTGYWGGQQAVCWVTTSPKGDYAWTTNPLTASISTYKVNKDGSIKLSQEIAYQASNLDEYFLDADLSADGKYMNTISGNTGKTWVFKIDQVTGQLSKVGGYAGSALTHSYGLVTVPVSAVQ
jgi:6-phosphogluconolactonase (cycloisomerase 2 family)